jgi:dolichol kinase
MTTQVATLDLSRALAFELHGLFRALDLRGVKTPELVRPKLDAACRRIDELLAAEWTLVPDAVLESIERVAELLRTWTADDLHHASASAWAELQAELRERYAGLSTALRRERVKVPELRPTNYARSGFHIGAALVCLLLVVLLTPQQLPWAAGAFAAWAWSMEGLRRVSGRANAAMMAFFRPIAHEQERDRVNSATWYMTSLVLLALTGSPILCVTGVAVLGLADPLAGLVGRRFGRVRLVNGRSLEGSLTFVVVGTLAARAAMLLIDTPLHSDQLWITALAAGLAGSVVELASRRVDDNLSIPMAAAGTAALVLSLLDASAWS